MSEKETLKGEGYIADYKRFLEFWVKYLLHILK